MSNCKALARLLSRKMPWGLVGMALLVAMVEACLERRAVDNTPWGTWAWRVTGNSVNKHAVGCDVLCFGDSLIKLGIIPGVIRERLGVEAYNFSICAAQAPASFFLLRRALESGARPRAVVVDYKPAMLAGRPRDFSRNWPELLNFRECIELSWVAHDPVFFAKSALAIVFPSIRARYDIRVNILLALHGIGSIFRDDTLRYWRNWSRNQGGQVTSPNPDFHGDVSADIQRRLMSHVFWCDRLNARYVRRFLTLARDHGIKVFWLLPPVSPAVQRERERTGAERGHERFVRALEAEFDNLFIVDGRHSDYGSTVFVDPLHLDRRGACTLSAELAEIVRQYNRNPASGPRWIDLPPFRPRATYLAFDEIVDANVALKLREGRRLR
jgi:hypothetical protein